ncbi:MAG TPA: hypothetical protein VFY28_03360 [Candidatus Paceibacterota bacterium]|nr:hypothetical protein [Candidatus Paceibacterota bacterium]
MRILLFAAAILWPDALAPAATPTHQGMAPVLQGNAEYCGNVQRAYRESTRADEAVYERQAREYERNRQASLWMSVNSPPAPAFDPVEHASGSTKFLTEAVAYCAEHGF